MADLGKVGITVKGEYDNTFPYEKQTVVSYQNGGYISKSSTTGNLPTDANYWTKLVSGAEATDLILGMVRLSSATDITDSTGLALPVTEKNPAISGTLASDISAESTKVGLLTNLTTTIKTSIVNAINSIVTRLGTTDISAIADGTVTGGISALNTNLTLRKVVLSETYGVYLEYNSFMLRIVITDAWQAFTSGTTVSILNLATYGLIMRTQISKKVNTNSVFAVISSSAGILRVSLSADVTIGTHLYIDETFML